MSITPAALRSCLDLVIEGLVELRAELVRVEMAADAERRLVQQAELAALFDLADADDTESE